MRWMELVTVLLVAGWIAPASAAPATPARSAADEPGAPSASRPVSRPAPASEHRFDALRIDGEQRGPAVLEVRALERGGRAPLLLLRRSFVKRIFDTIEAPALHAR